jgi:ribosomal-protein-alanine N-acetyltransferase
MRARRPPGPAASGRVPAACKHGAVTRCRLIEPYDAPALAGLLRVNREFLAPWEPARTEAYFTNEGQQAVIAAALAEHAQGRSLPYVIADDHGRLLGRITLSGIVRGSFLSCSVGYWVSQEANGRGLATSALAEVVDVAFGELGLHRIQAETLLGNFGSQRVLERNGFARIGMAPAYLKIAGRWQDMILFQLVNPAVS